MEEPVANGASANVYRARRFAIEVPMRYRVREGRDWYDGQIQNISRSGVLFRGEQLLGLGTQIEMSFTPSVAISGELAAEVICHGHIVRTVALSGPESCPILAATISEYDFRRRPNIIA